jgi:uroporphyrinogen decarboxylase
MDRIREWRNNIIANHRRQIMPLMTHPGIEMTGSNIKDASTNGEVHFEAMAAIAAKFPAAAATTMMDLSIEAEVFGSAVIFSDQEVPVISSRLVSNSSEIDRLTIPSINQGRIPEYLKATQLAVAHIQDRPVFAGCIGPFSLTGRLFDLSDLMMAILMEPDMIHHLVEKCTIFLQEYIREFKKIGAGGVIMAEPSAGMLSPDMCDEFSSSYIHSIVSLLQDDSFMIILHNCGNTNPLLGSLQKANSAGIHLGNQCNIETALQFLDSKIIVFGNLDPVNILRNGNSKVVKEQTLAVLKKTRDYRNFVISSGCDIPPGTPLENIQVFFDTVAEFNFN